ncbi:MAG: ABC transporter permease [Methanomicrobiales archaeon]|nr:ABC transporter permease [Methanomicrobiales archaeon]
MGKSIGLGSLTWNNLRNRPYRNIATMLCFAFIAGSLISAHFLVGGATNSLHSGLSRIGADLLVVPREYSATAEAVILKGQPSTFVFDSSHLEEVARIQGVDRAAPQLYIQTLSASCCSIPVQLIAYDPARDFTITPWLESRLGGPLAKDEIIIGSRIIGNVGETLLFYGHEFTIAGRLEPTGMGLDSSVFLRMEDAAVMAEESRTKAAEAISLPANQISSVLIMVDPDSDPSEVAARIQATIPDVRVIAPNYLIMKVTDQLEATTHLLYLATISVTLIALPLIAVISSMVASERRRDIGVLRALGASRPFIFRLIFLESISLAVIGGLIGIFTSFVIIFSFQDLIAASLQIPFLWPSPEELLVATGMALLLAITVGGVSSLYPAYRSSMLEPYEAIRRGEI